MLSGTYRFLLGYFVSLESEGAYHISIIYLPGARLLRKDAICLTFGGTICLSPFITKAGFLRYSYHIGGILLSGNEKQRGFTNHCGPSQCRVARAMGITSCESRAAQRTGLRITELEKYKPAAKLDGKILIGGRGGIRTHGEVAPSPVFKTGAFDHSATLPRETVISLYAEKQKIK